MARCKFFGGNDSCTSHVDVWPSGFAKDQSFKGSCAAPSIAGRIHASLEREDRLFGAQRLGVCFLSTERQAATGSEYARRRLFATRRSEGWNSFIASGWLRATGGGRSAPVRISQPSPQSRIVLGSHQNRSKDGANPASTQRCQIDAPVLQPRCQPGSHGRGGGNVNCDSQLLTSPLIDQG